MFVFSVGEIVFVEGQSFSIMVSYYSCNYYYCYQYYYYYYRHCSSTSPVKESRRVEKKKTFQGVKCVRSASTMVMRGSDAKVNVIVQGWNTKLINLIFVTELPPPTHTWC